jgi:hypothetical protein
MTIFDAHESVAARLAERDAIAAELADVKRQLVDAIGERDCARYQRDTALARLTTLDRRGW